MSGPGARPALLSIVAEMEATANGMAPKTHGETMQTAFLLPLMEAAPAWGDILHGDAPDGRGVQTPGGYTISPLFFEDPTEEQRGCFVVGKGTRAWFRLTAWRPEAVEALLLTARERREWVLVAGRWRVAFRILRWQGGPLGESGRTAEWTGAESPSSLERRAWRAVEESVPGFDRVTLGFLTPTAFRRTGATRWNATNPLPAPHLVWGSLQRRWRSAFPDDPAAEWSPEWMDRHLALGRFEVRSAMMAFERHEGKVPGFLGEVEYQFHRELTAAERVRLWMWSEFARYAGVGTMTAWGMGQTLRVGGIK